MSFKTRQPGFSLLEVLVAFSILSVSLGVLLKIFGGGTHMASVADEYVRATLLAESTLAATGVEEPLEEGETAGVFDDKYYWTIRVTPFESESDEIEIENLPAQAFAIDVNVEWGDDKNLRSINLNTLRLAPRE